MIKRSVKIAGHSTSVSLEEEFWLELKSIASRKNVSLNFLIEDIDKSRGSENNLSSAIRVYILEYLKDQT